MARLAGCFCMYAMPYVLRVHIQSLLFAVSHSAASPYTTNYAAVQAWMTFSPQLSYPKHKPFPDHLYMQLVFALS